MVVEKGIKLDFTTRTAIWDEHFGLKGIRPPTGTAFEIRIPAKRSKFLFGAQGHVIPRIRELCLAPVRFATEYYNDWLFISLWFPKTSRFNSQKAPSSNTANIMKQMGEGENSAASQESIRAKKEEQRLALEKEKLARQKAEEMKLAALTKKRQEAKQLLVNQVDEIIKGYPSDSNEDEKKSRSKHIRYLIAIEAKDEGLYSKGLGFTKSEVWTLVTDFWTKTRPKQTSEAQALMYSER
ncbi:hypothetical protein DHEL01_v212560 [Diaporthe helianthi]|uniref:Uncharacterized protein n=1 Tax=Diaporthe helianthi TaxID=158607 RepID=A0A2P5HFN2_DIAHE|nr:hypothetical protein DHEL01_v212560 [Diaporthe helianthi]